MANVQDPIEVNCPCARRARRESQAPRRRLARPRGECARSAPVRSSKRWLTKVRRAWRRPPAASLGGSAQAVRGARTPDRPLTEEDAGGNFTAAHRRATISNRCSIQVRPHRPAVDNPAGLRGQAERGCGQRRRERGRRGRNGVLSVDGREALGH